jgi:hypothetical protein
MENRVKSVDTLTQWFEESETMTYKSRVASERDRDYYDGIQWTDEEATTIKERGQPVITINRIKPKIDALTGMERQNRTDPKALPRNPGDEGSSEAITKALRYVADNSDYDQKRSMFYEDMIIQGIGAIEHSIKVRESGEKEIVLTNVPWDRFFYDPASVRPDFSDALYFGHVLWMDSERAQLMFPKKEAEIANISEQSGGNTHDDKPKWVDSKRKRIRIVKMYYLSGSDWYVATFTKGVDIENIVSPFVDEYNKTYPALNAMSAFIDRENNRYGVVRQMVDPQDEINKRRSKLLHYLSVSQLRVEPGSEAADKIEELRAERAKPDGIMTARAGEIEIMDNSVEIVGQGNLLQEAKGEIDAVGVNPTLQGKTEQGLSGRAIMAQQSAGVLELGTISDRKRFWDLKNYRIIYRLIRQYWDEPKWVRVTDEQGQPEFIGINQPITVRDQLEANPEIAQLLAQRGIDPNTIDMDEIMGYENSVGELDVDIIMEEAPDIATLKSEQFELLASSGVLQAMPIEVVLDLLPNITADTRKNIEDKLSGGDDPEAQQQAAAIAQKQQQIEEEQIIAEIEVKKSTATKNYASAEKTEMESRAIVSELADGAAIQ